MSAPLRVAVVGAGPAGLTALTALDRVGIEAVCFEKGDRPGGLWAYGAPLSGAYRSLHLNTSRERTQLERFPMPSDWPDFPSHERIGEYFSQLRGRDGRARADPLRGRGGARGAAARRRLDGARRGRLLG